MRGEQMALEMGEQPAALNALIRRAESIREQVRVLAPQPFTGVTIVARGSSDHAAVYGRYLIEALTGKPVSLAAPSLHTLYGIDADYRGQLVIAVSQSGSTPEIVQTLQMLQAAGGRGLAITNEDGSELAQVAHGTITLNLGRELAVPATKTVTGQLVAMAVVADALAAGPPQLDLSAVPQWIEQVLADPAPPARLAAALAPAQQLIIAARGYMFAAALETALKIKETCYLLAEGYSTADLRHGPIAAVTRDMPVVVMTSPGLAEPDVLSLAGDLRARQVSVYSVAASADADVSLPGSMSERLAPIVATVRGQQIAYELALALGRDPDTPRGLNKVTLT